MSDQDQFTPEARQIAQCIIGTPIDITIDESGLRKHLTSALQIAGKLSVIKTDDMEAIVESAGDLIMKLRQAAKKLEALILMHNDLSSLYTQLAAALVSQQPSSAAIHHLTESQTLTRWQQRVSAFSAWVPQALVLSLTNNTPYHWAEMEKSLHTFTTEIIMYLEANQHCAQDFAAEALKPFHS